MTVKRTLKQLTLEAGIQKRGQDGELPSIVHGNSRLGMSTLTSELVTMTAAGSNHPGNIEAGFVLPLFTPEGKSAASTASPSPRRTGRARMRFKEQGNGGETCAVVNCKRPPEVHVRACGWLCTEHHEKWLDQVEQDWRKAHAAVQ